MTRLFNLESYSDFCSYTQIFGQLSQPLESGIPVAYQSFLTSVRDFLFLQPPIVIDELPNPFLPRKEALHFCTVGIELDDQKNDNLLIVRDIDVLSLRHLKERYLYASAYRYWNFVSQLSHLAESKKPLVIYDLDSLPCPYYLPISFTQDSSFPHPIPILDTRKVEDYEKLKLPFNNTEIYDLICDRVARLILISHANISGIKVNDLIQYLKRINIFAVIKDYLNKNPNATSISVLIEVPVVNSENLYLSTTLKLEDVEEIILKSLPINKLKLIWAENYTQYNFVLLSQYNYFSNFCSSLKSYFFLPDINRPEFKTIWQQKLLQNFPLYGQYLDQISFEIKDNEKLIQVNVPDQIQTQVIYEGGREKHTFIGKYHLSSGEIKSSFIMRKKEVILPIKVNGKVRIENEKEQAYIIKNNYYDESSLISVEIYFSLALGKSFSLEVIDSEGRKLMTEQKERLEDVLLDYISVNTILEDRNKKEDKSILFLSSKPEFIKTLKNKLNEIVTILNKYTNCNKSPFIMNDKPDYIKLTAVVKDTYLSLLQADCLHYISPSKLREVEKIIASTQLSNCLYHLLPLLSKSYPRKKGETNAQRSARTKGIKEFYNIIILLVGKLYKFSGTEDFAFLFDYLSNSLQTGEHIQVIARISSQETFQKRYFQLFNQPHPRTRKEFYQDAHYMWGYARIMLWYLDFSKADSFVSYNAHFKLILQYSLTSEPQSAYLQSSLISLIYLLTFREINQDFCVKDSSEYTLSKELCDRLRYKPVYAKQISQDKSLNEIFEEFLEGTAGSSQVEAILEADSRKLGDRLLYE